MKKTFIKTALFSLLIFWVSCDKSEKEDSKPSGTDPDLTTNCFSTFESGWYKYFFRPQHTWVGDPIPYFENGTWYVFFLNDERPASDQYHPWHLVETNDAVSYCYRGLAIPCGDTNSQDIALGTGCVIKKDNFYYAFYTGHKWNHSPDQPKEAVMLAISSDLQKWKKQSGFLLFAPVGYDQNEFRDPYIFYDKDKEKYIMLVSARKNNRAVLAQFVSKDLLNWELMEPFYSDDSIFMLECIDLFCLNEKWYFIYSNINDRRVYYLVSHNRYGPWKVPENNMFDGSAYYAAKSAGDENKRLLFGWCPTRIDDEDTNEYSWGGSLVVHQLKQAHDGRLLTTIPETLDSWLEEDAPWGIIEYSEDVVPTTSGFVLNASQKRQIVKISRLNEPFKISTIVKADSEAQNFGFVFGACETLNSVYALHIDLNEELLKLAYLSDWNSPSTTYQVINSIPITIPSSRTFEIKIVVEKSVCVMYVDDKRAFTNRIYKMSRNPWMIFSDTGIVTFDDFSVTVAKSE
ncbi:glycoside hydrolase domain-containing protein [Thermophagus sp. OGC60D27]|uniref:glycoside hydrolase domain-containing protein n=1 Tax=Thermophagus sp. OGC60D27 TaxID=3458415 RepID=UPI004038375D